MHMPANALPGAAERLKLFNRGPTSSSPVPSTQVNTLSVKPLPAYSQCNYTQALPGAAERLKLFKADLLQPGSFDGAFQGCDFVVHVASPFIVNVAGAEAAEKLVEPAVQGTAHVLGEC